MGGGGFHGKGKISTPLTSSLPFSERILVYLSLTSYDLNLRPVDRGFSLISHGVGFVLRGVDGDRRLAGRLGWVGVGGEGGGWCTRSSGLGTTGVTSSTSSPIRRGEVRGRRRRGVVSATVCDGSGPTSRGGGGRGARGHPFLV